MGLNGLPNIANKRDISQHILADGNFVRFLHSGLKHASWKVLSARAFRRNSNSKGMEETLG